MGIESQVGSKIEFSSMQNSMEKQLDYGIISRGLETIAVATPIEYELGFMDNYVEAIKDGHYPVVVANHTSLADAIVLSKLTYVLTNVANDMLPVSKQLNGFMLPLSKSLDNGKQGRLRQEFYNKSRPMLAKYDLYPVITTTKNDVEKRGLNKNSHDYSSELIMGMKNNYGIAVLGEGTVKGGKKVKPEDELNDLDKKRIKQGQLNVGSRYGMQPLAQDSMAHIVVNTKRYKKTPVVFIPVGIEGGYNIFNPDTGLPSITSLMTGLNLGKISEIASIKVGIPLSSDGQILEEIVKNKNWGELDKTVGKNIARLIPQELRGVYA